MPELQGRAADIGAIETLMDQHRLVTIVGLGGMGKTAVALHLQNSWGCPLVDLSRITADDGVAPLVAATLNAAEQSTRTATERVVRHLGEGCSTLVLDNCEHVLGGVVDLVVTILEQCPGVSILATSTVRLGVGEEHIHELPPLGLPPEGSSLAEVREADACVLFRRRVRQYNPNFEISSSNMDDVSKICWSLDGHPLALELAAARMSVLSASELSERLHQRFGLLTKGGAERPKRHQTLRAMVEWSHERCTPAEQKLWARLSVFNGSFRLHQAEDICGFGELERESVLDLLDGLVCKSLLQVEHGDRVRYRQLMTIRDFGAERLEEYGEADQCRDNLLAFTLRSTREMMKSWVGPGQAESLETWRLEHGTIVAGLRWAMAEPTKHDQAADLLTQLLYHWISGGHLGDGRAWFERVLASDSLSPERRANAEWVAAWVCMLQGDLEAGLEHLTAADPSTDPLARTGHRLVGALGHMFGGDCPAAVPEYEAAIEMCWEMGEPGLAMSAMFQLGMAQTYAGMHAESLETTERLIRLAEEHEEHWNRAYGLWVRGLAHWHRGELEEAERAVAGAIGVQLGFADGICVAVSTLVLVWVRVARGDATGAAALQRVLDGVWERIGTTPAAFGSHVAEEHARCGPVTHNEQVRPVPIRRAVQEVLALVDGADASMPTDLEELSPREREVLACLGEGFSNREIAETLFISQRTAEGHVHRILGKLGLRSRAEVASWYARQMLAKP